jgi:16S rRNA (guanine527-N7)-methyltransferase
VARRPHSDSDPGQRIPPLVARYALPPGAESQLRCLLEALAADPVAPTALREPGRIIDDHLADSLVALELEEVRRAATALDIGAGAGLPGLPLAAALPHAAFVLLESAGRKCEYLHRVVERCGLSSVEVVHARAESWPEGLRGFDLVTARAVAALPVVLEYAAPLLRLGGSVVAWRGRRVPDEERAADKAASELGLRAEAVRHVQPYPEAQHRHLHVWSKVMETPSAFPRRPGAAAKRPLGAR